jgi:hypothetical protein
MDVEDRTELYVNVTEVEQIERSRKPNKKHKRDRLECLDLDRQQ